MSETNRRAQLLLQPDVQLRMGIYGMALAASFALALVGILHAQWLRLRTLHELHGLRAEADAIVLRHAQQSLTYLGVTLAIYAVASILVSVVLTHRLVGPTVAFRRHIRALIAGDYSARTRLRDHDAFEEVALDLNRLSEVLAQRAAGAADSEGAEGAPPPEPAAP